MSALSRGRAYPRAIAFPAFLLAACAGPRSVLEDAAVTPKGHVRVAADAGANIATATSGEMAGSLSNEARDLMRAGRRGDSVVVSAASWKRVAKSALIMGLDPSPYPQFGLGVRYGWARGFDAGYHWNGAHQVDLAWQFLGPGSRSPWTAAGTGRTRATLGLGYAWQSFEFPSILSQVQDLTDYSMERKDLLVPLAFGGDFGDGGRFGGWAAGLSYAHTWLKYGFGSDNLFVEYTDRLDSLAGPGRLHGENDFSSYGAFANIRGGYRRAFAVAGLGLYWQDYGRYRLPGVDGTVGYRGLTILPRAGIEFAL